MGHKGTVSIFNLGAKSNREVNVVTEQKQELEAPIQTL